MVPWEIYNNVKQDDDKDEKYYDRAKIIQNKKMNQLFKAWNARVFRLYWTQKDCTYSDTKRYKEILNWFEGRKKRRKLRKVILYRQLLGTIHSSIVGYFFPGDNNF